MGSMQFPHRSRSGAVGSDDHRSVTLARDLRVAVSLTRDHACLLLDSRIERIGDEQRRSVEAILRQTSRIDWLIDELDARWTRELGIAPTPPPPPIEERQPRPRVLLADDDPDCLENLANLLAPRYEVATARDGREALDRLRAEPFDLAILDQHMPGHTGLEVAEQFAIDAPAPLSFMFLSGEASAKVRVRGLSLGAADFLSKPLDPDELLARVARIIATERRERSLTADALIDSLTGLANYRSLARNLELELERAHRYDLPLSLLAIDLDNLKYINDELGHSAGDDAICLVASVLQGAVRKFETVARQGGDELSILSPNATESDALQLGERIRREVAQRSISGRPLSISVGVASRALGDKTTSVRSLVNASDEALYRSKRAGRNRVSGPPIANELMAMGAPR
jgi:two-component system cell cycle response regulator